jgi:hypothetical protein
MGAAGAFGAVLVLLARHEAMPATAAALASAMLVAAALCAAAWRRRGHGFSLADARARLDRVLGLNDRLASAAEGVAAWPAPMPHTPDGMVWRPGALAAPLCAWAAPLALALCVPVGVPAAAGTRDIVQPVAWLQVEAGLAALEEEPAFDAAALEAARRKLDALRSAPPEAWYGHGSLEAGDALREQVQRSLAELSRSLDNAGHALDDVEQSAGRAAGDGDSAREGLTAALQALAEGAFPLTDAARRTLEGAGDEPASGEGARSPRRASADAQRRMLENLQAAAQEAAHEGGLPMTAWERRALAPPGLSRGPGAAPLALRDQPSELQATRDEAVRNDALSRALPGETVGVRAVRPDLDADAEVAAGAPGPGGAASSGGSGGEATWRISLPPDEQAILRRYFR